ncbi:MAG: multiple sugar transport system permease protein [Rhodothermales bacterium]|jgi:multiple sugar transport system permease protein
MRNSPPRFRMSQLLLLLPFFAMFAVFWLMPLLEGIRQSLHSNTLYGESSFVGLAHYREIFGSIAFKKAIANTAIYTVAVIGFTLPLALLLAHLLRACWGKMRPLYTMILLLPGLTPPAVLALLFLLVFHGRTGILNHLFVIPFGARPIKWLVDPDVILWGIIIQGVWRWVGLITFFLLAALEAVPKQHYEVARLEGARWYQTLRYVTLPAIRHVMIFAAIYLLVDAVAAFSGAYVMLGGSGGTADAGLLMVNHAYREAFSNGKFGTAAAVAVSVAPILLVLVGMLLWPLRRRADE